MLSTADGTVTRRVTFFSGLVIFYCTLLSLRGHDDGKVVTKIQDYELAGETELYGG